MKTKLIGKFTSSNFIDLGGIYPVGFAIFKGNISKTIQYSLDNVTYFQEEVEVNENKIIFSKYDYYIFYNYLFLIY